MLMGAKIEKEAQNPPILSKLDSGVT